MMTGTDKEKDADETIPSEPPGSPDRTPVEDPDKNQKPMVDPQPPSKKKPRLEGNQIKENI